MYKTDYSVKPHAIIRSLYLDRAKVIGLSKSIQKHLKIRENSQGWTDSQVVLSLVLLNLAGGDCVDDLKIMEADEGFCAILRKSEMHGLKRKVRRALERRRRKEKKRSVPSLSAVFRYLSEFHVDYNIIYSNFFQKIANYSDR